jgi:cytochrome c-type biogenesis protein CcmH
MMRIFLFLIFSLIIPATFAESMDLYPFPRASQQQQFQGLINQLRCMVCQNQNLADSNADLAKDLRRQVYEMVLANKSDQEIKQYMISRYGDFILFKPPFKIQTMVLWLAPFLFLLIGLLILWRRTL